jgi:hypothetical protein
VKSLLDFANMFGAAQALDAAGPVDPDGSCSSAQPAERNLRSRSLENRG